MAQSKGVPPPRRRNNQIPVQLSDRKERSLIIHDAEENTVMQICQVLGDESGDSRPFECIQHSSKDKLLTIVYRNKKL